MTGIRAATMRANRARLGPPPYAFPTAAPWHAPTPCVTPAPDGTNYVIHPDVVDFGPTRRWHGWRYWMACTPFAGRTNSKENPSILVSQNGFHWEVPSGIVNPIYPDPPPPRFNSDTDLTYDPETDALVLTFRQMLPDGTHQHYIARSPDGRIWPAKLQPLNWTRLAGSQLASPAFVRRAAGDWWLYGVNGNTARLTYYRATSPEAAWTGPSVIGTWPLALKPWHVDVIYHGGAFRALVDCGPEYKGYADGYVLGSSVDGSTWTWATGPVMDLLPGPRWDDQELYRATIQPHEDGTHMQVWYSALTADNPQIGYTLLPHSLWPAV